MKILLKRNSGTGSNMPATVSAGEPLWFKDILYVGSVGTSAGGVEATTGTPVRVAMYRDLASIDHNQTIKGNGTAFGADAAVNIAPGSNISVTANASSNTITIANTYSYTHPSAGTNTGSFGPSANATPSYGQTFSVPYITVDSDGHVTAASTKTITIPASDNTDAKVKQTLVSGNSSYPIILKGTTTATDSPTEGVNYSASAKINASTGVITAGGFVKSGGTSTQFLKADGSVDTNTYLTASDIGSITGAMVYRGTTTTLSTSTLGYDVGGITSGYTPATGDVLVASSNVTGIVPSTATSGTKTTLAGKNINTNGDTTIETGDMLIYNGTLWYVVSGEGQVDDKNVTLAWSTQKTIATVDGKDIHVTLPANPNTDTSVTAVGNHYSPSTDSSAALTASATGATAAWGIDVVKGLTISRDAKGHVTGVSLTSGKIPANPNTNQTVKSGNSTFGANAAVNITANTGLSASATTTSGSEEITITHATPTGAAATSSGFYKIATDERGHVTGTAAVTASDITGLVGTIPTVNNGTLTVKGQYTGSSGSTSDSSGGSLFTANQSGGSTLTITGTGGIKTYRNTNTNAITVQHTNSVTAVSTAGLYKVKYDAQGHITGTTDVAKDDITALGIPGSDTNDTYTFSTIATDGKFSDSTSGSVHSITLTEIDGGTF